MTDIEDQGADDLLEDIYDETPPEHSVVSRADFKPWHHPRKHWVRINQLCSLAQSLFSDTHFQDNTIRYLTLPGEELLDVQTVEIIAKSGAEELLDIQALQGSLKRVRENLQLKYLGFNNVGTNREKMAAQEHIESILRDMETIHRSSRVINNLVQTIANENSTSYRDVRENGPYNLINLDLCDSVASRAADTETDTYFDAIGKILELQRAHMSQPFMMLIATRTEPQDIDPKSLAKIVGIYGENFRASETFKRKFEEIIAAEAEDLLYRISEGAEVSQDALNRVFGVGLGKWLLHLMKPNAPHWDVSLEHICCYSIGDYESNMLSLAFKFTKVNVGMNDEIGLFRRIANTVVGSPKTEAELAIEMLERARTITNVDTLLQGDQAQREKIIGQASRLLGSSGYSAEQYVTWANSLFEPPPQTATG